MIDIKKNPEAVGKLKVGTSAATPADNSILASDLVQAERLIAKKSTGSGNTEIKIENDSASNAAVLTLEGKRTSDNDCAQILIANSGENVAAIKGFRSGANDAGKLEIQTSASGSSGLASRLSISSTGLCTFANGIQVNDAAGGMSQIQTGGAVTIADDASITLSTSSNQGSLISVYHNTFGSAVLFYVTYSAVAQIISDPDSFGSASDTDGKMCMIKTANSHSMTFKNRLGSSVTFKIAQLGGNLV